jgi:PAS domain S-box-containing protein
VLVQDVTESRRAELFEREQREVLEAIAIGEALDDTLTRVVRLFEYLHPGATCAVMLFDPSSGCMRPGPAPGLPAAYCAALDGVPIGVTAGSCGTAMFFGERVVTVDTANDPLWADFRHLAQAYGLVACWSQPFMSRSGTPLGSLAVYQQERREPNAREIAALETLAAICAIAVERAQSQRQIEESEQRFRSLFDNQPDAVYSLDRDGCITSINEAVVALSGMPREAILGRHYESLIDIDSAEEVRGYFRRALAGTAQRYATVGVRADGSRRQLDVTNLPIVVDGVITGLFGVARDVTEQRAIEARLLERDRFFSLSPLVFTISGHGPCFSQVNDALPRLLGFSREQLLQRPIAEFIIADDLPSTRAAVGGLAADSNLTAFINRYRCADGGIRWLEWNALRADDGTIFATARDVTEQTLSAQSEALMRRVLESSPAVLWRWLPQWGWPAEFVTENVAQWGYAPADFTSRRVNYADLLHPSDAAAYVAAMEESDRSGADSFEFVYRLRTADGRWAWVDERTAIVRHPDGSVNYWQGVTLDVSVREEAREALLQRDRFFELSPDLFAIITGEGRYLQVNRAFTTLLGHGAEALLGRPYTDFVHPDDLDAARADRLGLDASARIDAVALRQLCRDGSTRLVLWNALRMPDGGILVSGRDVTEERRAQEQERLLTRIIEGSPAVMWRWGIGPGAAVSLVSENVRQWGYEPDDFLSGRLDFVHLVHPDDVDAAMACMAQAALPGIDHYRGTYRVRKADGSWIWVDERTTIMRDADGVAQYLQGITLDVTDAQRAREDERQLVVAIETGPAVLWRFDPHAAPTTLSVTANVARWGYAPDDFTSGRLRFVDLLHPDDYDEVVVGSLRRIEAGANELMREYRMRTADGRWVWIDEYLQVIRDRDRRRVLCLSLALDTTETRMAREQERQLRQVIELSPAVLWRFDLSRAVPTSLVSSNVSQWGYVPEDFTSGRLLFDDLIHPDDHARVVQVTRSAIAGGAREVQVDFRFRTADGRWVWLDERVTMVRDRDGTLVDSVSLTLDVTAQRDALAAVHERDQFYALSLEVFAVVDSRGCFRQASEALVRVLGYPLEAIIGHPLLEFVHADDLARTQAHMRTLADGGRIDSVELRCRHAGGGWRWLEWNAAAGPAGLYYCAARDVTDHKRVSAELRRALLDLELRNVELQDFAFVASHDLQEPLRKVQAFTDRVIARYADRLDAQGVDYLRRMDAAAGRMQTLIDDLLAYSRVSTRGESFRAVDLGRVLDEVQADLEARLESSGGQIVSGALPLIEADPTQMRQLLQNLLGNALKFAVPGRRPLVEVSAERVELVVPGAESRSGWRLTVSDNGIGFDNAQAERIFVPFQRLHGRSEYEGTGMGLAIVRKIVERHGGTISACAQPGQGAKFMVELPATQLKPVRNGGQQPAIMASGGID